MITQQANCSGLMYADHVNVSKNAYSANLNVIDAGISKHILVVGNVYLVISVIFKDIK